MQIVPRAATRRRIHSNLWGLAVSLLVLALSVWMVIVPAGIASAQTPKDDHAASEPKIHIIPTLGTNVGVIEGENALIIIDPGFPEENASEFMRKLRELSAKPVAYVFNTHAHYDHSEGNGLFAREGAKVIGHSNLKYSSAHVDWTFSSRLPFKEDGLTLEAFYIPSHSYSDILIHIPEANTLFLGDSFTTNSHPTFYAGGIAKQNEVIDLALSLADDDTKIVPGHGVVSTRQDLIAYRDKTNALYDHVITLIDQGWSERRIHADEEYQSRMLAFNGENRSEFLDSTAVRRFAMRVANSEALPSVDLDEQQLELITGIYRQTDGATLEVVVERGAVFLRRTGDFIAELLPLGGEAFRMRAMADVEVSFVRAGAHEPPTALLFRNGEDAPVEAVRSGTP